MSTDDPEFFGETASEQERQAARRAICARARDAADARELMLALGLLDPRTQRLAEHAVGA